MEFELRDTFFSVINCGNENARFKRLFNYCIKIAEAYAGSSSKVTKKNLYKWNIKFDDLVFDSVSPLFIKNNKDVIELSKSFENWNNEINDDGDVDFFLHRVVWKSVEQRITQLLKESDPFFAKILKTISVGINKYDFKKVNYFGTVYIISAEHSEIAGPVIKSEEFLQIPNKYFLRKQKKLLDGLLNYIGENTNCFPALPLYEMVKRIKSLLLLGYNNDADSDDINMLEIRDLIEKARVNVQEKINSTYSSKNKLSKIELEKISDIFNGISRDLMDGGMNINLVNYFEEYFPSVPREEYYNKYQKILYYLYNIYRNELSSKLR